MWEYMKDKDCLENLISLYNKGYEILHNDDPNDDFKAIQIKLLIDNEIQRLLFAGLISPREKKKLQKKYSLSLK